MEIGTMGSSNDSIIDNVKGDRYDILIIGPVSLDCNIDYLGNERRELGGAIVQSGYAAANSDNKVAVYTKFNQTEVDKNNLFEDIDNITLMVNNSSHTCSIKNIYNTPDCEERKCISAGVCDRFYFDEIRDITTDIYYFAGLIDGDFDEDMIILTKGGPANTTATITQYIYNYGVKQLKVGYGCAASVIMTVIILIISSGYIRQNIKKVA